MKKKIVAAIAALVPFFACAGEGNGYLTRESGLGGFDFYDVPELNLNASQQPVTHAEWLAGRPLKLQARFTWLGNYGSPITASQHALISLSQVAVGGQPTNPEGQQMFTSGIGAFVGETGLSMELWFRNYPLAKNDAFVWDQTKGRCARTVQGVVIPEPLEDGTGGTMCLSAQPNQSGFITSPATPFTLRYGVHYWVQAAVTAEPANGVGVLRASLFEDVGTGPVLVQTGLIGFPLTGDYTPFPNQGNSPIRSTVARTPGSPSEPTVQYYAFDYGF